MGEWGDRWKLAGLVGLIGLIATAVGVFMETKTAADVRLSVLDEQLERVERSIDELEELTGNLRQHAARIEERIEALEEYADEAQEGSRAEFDTEAMREAGNG
jgi:F0F1-type ATP synthase membrane subunit b/b'